MIVNIIKHAGIILLNSFIIAIGMMGGVLIWLMLAPGIHYWIDFLAVLGGFILTFKTGLAMYIVARYPSISPRDAPIIPWKTQWAFLRGILAASAIIIPSKILSNFFFSMLWA